MASPTACPDTPRRSETLPSLTRGQRNRGDFMAATAVVRRLLAAALVCVLLLLTIGPAHAAPPPDPGPPPTAPIPPTAGPPIDPGAQGKAGPSVPTGLAAQPLHEAIRLSWSATVDAKVVLLHVQRDGVEVATLAPTDVTWLDSGLVAGRE